ncbi:MAG: TonB-dependent receptor [Alphaproteobacteria bacterium]|nr:TonB-dependent receptor [Alphaproteobacteria bacterium]MBU2352442.1 TonB-dependent receptor [Alphaproteobacteria bacterium]MBU2381876.1 TonB-dependent receptor [Alphaproteobacteria bacterium]
MLLKRKHLFGTTILAGVMAIAAAPAFAQEAPAGQDPDTTEVEEIVVTGSRIRRDPTTAPTPLIQVTREDLLNTGQNTVIDYLATIPALANSRLPSDTTNTGVDGLGLLGLSTANLRSLGSNRTLVLIDGRRQVSSLQGSLQVDVDTVPRLLIQSIEIITGGASSVYGADAVSGVLNFVLQKDFEGLEIDTQYSMINQNGEANKRFSVLGGINLLDDRLNLWAHAEYEQIDEIRVDAIDWFGDSWGLVTIDADQILTGQPQNDGQFDLALFQGINTISRPRWGQTTLANTEQPSRLSNPLTPFATCNTTSLTGYLSGNCYPVDPEKTWVFDGPTARLANFGQRIGVGFSRTLMIGGDGQNNATFGQQSRTPENESVRLAAGANFEILPNLNFTFDYKYNEEDASALGQPTFFDVFLTDRGDFPSTVVQPQYTWGPSNFTQFNTRLDNAFLPSNLRSAILSNTLQNYSAPTQNADGVAGAVVAAPFARHSLFGPDRGQRTNRTVERFVAALDGSFDNVPFIRNFNWDVAYVYGKGEQLSFETGVDAQRFALAADSVVDPTGAVNGTPGEIVCRAQLIAATGGFATDWFRSQQNPFAGPGAVDLRDSVAGTAELNDCTPLNIFGEGNQSAEALEYVYAEVSTFGVNEQEQILASVSGELWDFWGAGSIGVALGAEWRTESTSELGRDNLAGDRNLFLNGSPDFPYAEYDTQEYFAELSIPLLRDSWLGEYAELSGSYRTFDYSQAGTGEVYGVNFLYRPVRDIGFKTSFNTSFRAPTLGEALAPQGQTFANGFVDPCATTSIAGQTAEIRTNRIANCELLAIQRGYAAGFFDFASNTATNTDDYVPVYTSGISGLGGGNPTLTPEESESFTFSIVSQPRWFPNLTLVLDYYEIEITDAIATLSAAAIAANCVDSTSLTPLCNNIFRNTPFVVGPTSPQERSEGFKVGDPSTQVGFIQGPVNFQGFQTRGLDFTLNYRFDAEEAFGLNIGQFGYSLRGSWLMDQKSFTNASNPNAFTEASSSIGLPRVRFTSSLTWVPTEDLSVNWTVDWQAAQDIVRPRDAVVSNQLDSRPYDYYSTGNFARHDFTVRYQVNDELTLRTGVVNAFDAEQAPWTRAGFNDNFDPYGTRFFFGLNYRPW